MKRFRLRCLRRSLDEEALDPGTSRLILLQEGFRGKPKTVPEKARCPEQLSNMPRELRERNCDLPSFLGAFCRPFRSTREC